MVTATRYTDKDVAVGNLKLHYQEWGEPSAPAILMLHGFGVSGHMFDEFAERAADRYRLIALDQRGHGDSDWSEEGDYSRDAFVADIEGFRQAIGLDAFILVGHSMGGMNAVTYTSRYPERVRALVLVDVGPESAKEGVENIIRFTRGPDHLEFDEFVEMASRFNPRRSKENIRERMRHRLKPTDDGKWTWKFDSRFREKDGGALRVGSDMSNDETWKIFRGIGTPTLLVRGAESDVLSEEVAERVVREMPNARLALVPAAGHSVPGDNPDDFTSATLDFLRDVEEGRFRPEAGAEAPSLERLVESNGHRRPGVGTLVVAGAAAVLAVGGVTFLVQRNRKKQQERRRLAVRRPEPHVPTQAEIEAARQRMSLLAGDLAHLGRERSAEAVQAIRDADLALARERALGITRNVAGQAAAVPDAVRRVDRKKLKKRGRSAAHSSQAAALLIGQLLLKSMNMLSSGGKRARKRGKRRWRT